MPVNPCDGRALEEHIERVNILAETTSKTLIFDRGNRGAELTADGSRHRKVLSEIVAAANLLRRTWRSLNLMLATVAQALCKPSSAVWNFADCRIIRRLGI